MLCIQAHLSSLVFCFGYQFIQTGLCLQTQVRHVRSQGIPEALVQAEGVRSNGVSVDVGERFLFRYALKGA